MECPHILEISYGDFSERLHRKMAEKRIPLGGGIELTFRCNVRCAHCYIDHNDLQKELTYEEICAILDQAVEEGCLWLLITGGEPLVRKDFVDIYTYAKKKGMLITLFTNGTLIDESLADYLQDWRPFSVEITLYGITQETYEKVTGVRGSFKRCMEGIHNLLERNISLKLKTMVMTLNKHELYDMKKYAEDLELDFRYDPVLNPMLNGSNKPAEVAITPEEVVELDVNDQKRLESWQRFGEKFWGPPTNFEYLYNCGAGISSFHVDPYGKMSVCILSREPSYDLRQGPFREGWYELFPQIRAEKRKKNHPCAYCEKISLCGQCPGWARLEHGDPEKPVDYLCRVANLRAKAFGLNEPRKKEVI